jgi:hypothetical protein
MAGVDRNGLFHRFARKFQFHVVWPPLRVLVKPIKPEALREKLARVLKPAGLHPQDTA